MDTTTHPPRLNGASANGAANGSGGGALQGVALAANRETLIGQVDVKLETIVGRATLTIAELHSLKAGGVVALDTSLSDAVELRLNGVIVGYGELVAVGDQFGVRITAIAS